MALDKENGASPKNHCSSIYSTIKYMSGRTKKPVGLRSSFASKNKEYLKKEAKNSSSFSSKKKTRSLPRNHLTLTYSFQLV